MDDKNKEIIIEYANWKNVTGTRVIKPVEIWFGETEWHKGKQWFLKALDVQKNEERDFALLDIIKIQQSNIADPSEEIKAQIEEVKLFTDGGSRGNPGPSAIGLAILDMDDELIKTESKYLGVTTNNQAEYLGLKEGLQLCLDMKVTKLHIHMDSLLVINQMKGIYKVKNADILPVYQSVKDLVSKFSLVTFTHIPRELNKIADGMVNECLDSQNK